MDFIKTKDLQQVHGYTLVLARHTVTEDEHDYLDGDFRYALSRINWNKKNVVSDDDFGELRMTLDEWREYFADCAPIA